jgi:hypothetical protein
MTNQVDADGMSDRAGGDDGLVPMDGTETVECYESDGGVVLYDAENPLAWIETDTAMEIAEMA